MFAEDTAIAASAGTVNKAELANLLSCSLPTLDKLIRRHGDAFPIARRGTNGVAYAFSPAAVFEFLGRIESDRAAAGRAKDELMQQYMLPGTTRPEEQSVSPGDLIKLAKLRQLERDEQKAAGFLIEKTEVRLALNAAFAHLRRDIGNAVRQTLRDHNVPDTVSRSIEARIADAQRTFVATCQAALKSEQPLDGDQPALI